MEVGQMLRTPEDAELAINLGGKKGIWFSTNWTYVLKDDRVTAAS